MTEEQKYNELLKELATLIKAKNDTIEVQKWQIADLTAKLEEKEIALEEANRTIAFINDEYTKLKGGAQ